MHLGDHMRVPDRAPEAASTSGRPFSRVFDAYDRPLIGRRIPGGRIPCVAKLEGGAGEVTLLDYGAGNVRSVRNAVKRLGYTLKEVR
jgi:hypothetical protein